MLSDRESARDKAYRKWHNANIIARQTTTNDVPRTIDQQKPSKQRMEILSIFKEQTTETLLYYSVLIHERRKKLLREKLKRLNEAQHND